MGSSPHESPLDQNGGWTSDNPEPQPGDLVVSVDEDGGVTVKTHQPPPPPVNNDDFDENLAERPELQSSLGSIAEDIMQGVEDDLLSRQGWIANYTAGLDLLGLKIDTRSDTKGQRRNVSRVRDTTLLETVVKAQSQARRELIPASGPCKVSEAPGTGESDDRSGRGFRGRFQRYLDAGDA